MERMYCTAIVLAGGSGKRMGTSVHKQYLLMGGKPVLYYSLKAFQDSELIDEIILVTGAGEETYCRETIVDKYSLSKVSKIIPGGAERYLSVLSTPNARLLYAMLSISNGGWCLLSSLFSPLFLWLSGMDCCRLRMKDISSFMMARALL